MKQRTIINKIVKASAGIAMLPLCYGFTAQLARAAISVSYKQNAPYHFLLGCAAYLVVHLLFRRPILTYVFGHELTHALFALIFGGSVKSFHASQRGGRVTITKSNFIITLAPYFFPLYTFIALTAHTVAGAAGVNGAGPWLVALAGATYAFHLLLTFSFLSADQDDIREHGALFSYPLIYLFNIVFLALLMRLLVTENMDFFAYLRDAIIASIEIVLQVLGLAKGLL